MPKLLAYLPCEKVVEDKGTNNVSIVSVFQGLEIMLPSGLLPPPPGSYIPMVWAILTMWFREEGDDQQTFQSKSEVLSPDGNVLLETEIAQFNFSLDNHRNISNINGFPIWTPGTCQLVLKLKRIEEPDFHEVTRFPIQISHKNQG